MSYALGGLIEATDYNSFITTVNTAWSTGASSSGYGQPAFTPVSSGSLIYARPATVVAGSPPSWSTTPEWRTLINSINTMSLHQIGTIPISAGDFTASLSYPTEGTIISYASTVVPAISAVTSTQRLNAVAQGGTTTSVFTSTTTWSTQLLATFNVSFPGNDAARYFFNAGGQLGIQCSHPAGAVFDIDQLISDLCSDAGTVWISSTAGTPATVSLAGTSYNGITKVGGANPGGVTISPSNGFYALTAASTQVFRQTSDFVYHAYGPGTNMTINVSYNNAGLIVIQVLFDLVPDGAVVSSGTVVTLTARFPSTTYLVDTWNPVTITNF